MDSSAKETADKVHASVYEVGDRLLGIQDLLERFADPRCMKDGIPRLSDLHLKVGEPACTLERHLQRLADAGVITQEEARRHRNVAQAKGMP